MRGVGGLLDRYVARRFVGTYGLVLLGFVMLFLVLDLASTMDDFLESKPAFDASGESLWLAIGEYYLTKIPPTLTLIGPFLTLFAVISTLIGFSRGNEIVPMLCAGRGLHRVLAPIYVASLVLVAVLVGMEEFVGPYAQQRHEAANRRFEGRGGEAVDRLPHLRDGDNAFVASRWLPGEEALEEVRSPPGKYVDPRPEVPRGTLRAASIRYRVNAQGVEGWFPRDATVVPAEEDAEGRAQAPIRLPLDEPIALTLTPDEVDLLAAEGNPAQLTRAELHALHAEHPEQHGLTMELYARITRPVSSFVLLLLGLPFLSRHGKKSVAAGLGIALITCIAYFAVEFLFKELGTRGDVRPLVAAWFAPVFFGAIGIAGLTRVST